MKKRWKHMRRRSSIRPKTVCMCKRRFSLKSAASAPVKNNLISAVSRRDTFAIRANAVDHGGIAAAGIDDSPAQGAKGPLPFIVRPFHFFSVGLRPFFVRRRHHAKRSHPRREVDLKKSQENFRGS